MEFLRSDFRPFGYHYWAPGDGEQSLHAILRPQLTTRPVGRTAWGIVPVCGVVRDGGFGTRQRAPALPC